MDDRLNDLGVTPLKLPVFRAIWTANLFSNIGGLVQIVGASWLMASMGASPKLVAMVQMATALPIMLLSMPAGAVADNFDRRLVMLWAQGTMFLLSLGLASCTWLGMLNPTLLLIFSFAIACGTAFNNPAWQASVSDMVPRRMLQAAVTLNSLNFNIARTVGPAIGGVIVAVAGAATAFLFNALSYIAVIAAVGTWRPNSPPPGLSREGLGTAMFSGIRFVALSGDINVVLIRVMLFASAASALPALMPVVAMDLLEGGPLVYGAMFSSFGIGAVIGALASGTVRRRFSAEAITRISGVVVALGVALVGTIHSLTAAIPAVALVGVGWILAFSTFNSTLQLATPRWVLARAFALYQMALFGGLSAGSLVFGYLAQEQNVSIALLAAALWQAIGLLIGLRFPLPSVEHLDLAPLRSWQVPTTAVEVESQDGPIVIIIEYRISDADVAPFLSAMRERSRIRRRDGARHWTLFQDLHDPCLWVERYDLPTWMDYVRHSQRRTQADADNSKRLLALHQGAAPPRIRRLIQRQMRSVSGAPGSALDPSVQV